MKNKVLPVSVLVLFMLMCINACGISKSRDSADMVSELNNRIIEKVAENYEEGNISALDIVIVRIDFGSFSQDNASEIFVLCKILIINLRDFCISQRVLPCPERTATFGFMAAKQISNAA